jgi:hypothetical protein
MNAALKGRIEGRQPTSMNHADCPPDDQVRGDSG